MKKILFSVLILFVSFMTIRCGSGSETTADSRKEIRYVRKNASSEAAAKDLEALDKALAIMRTMDCSDPASWYYQGAMHWVPDTITGSNSLCESYQTMADLKTAWDNCTHSDSGEEEIHFLVWHRFYIYHFEKIVRKLSGYEEFALPYWGYTDTADTLASRTMPAFFRNNTSALFEPARLDSLNQGIPISGRATRKLSLTKLNEYHHYSLFNKNIDVAPHGAMHNYIGFGNDTTGKFRHNQVWQQNTYGMMAEVATAAFDPIFWTHHSNIDRIWQQWTNSTNGQQVLLDELKSVPWAYVFFDENGDKVQYSIDEVFDQIYNMDYDFDDTPVLPKISPKQDVKLFSLKNISLGDTIAKNLKAVSLKNARTRLSLPKTNKENLQLFSAENPKGHILLLTITVSFEKAPKGDYEVYLNLPGNIAANPESDHFAGFMTFFGANHTHGAHAGHAHHQTRKKKTFIFEISDEALDTDALNKSSFDISFFKSGGSALDDIQLENVHIIKQ